MYIHSSPINRELCERRLSASWWRRERDLSTNDRDTSSQARKTSTLTERKEDVRTTTPPNSGTRSPPYVSLAERSESLIVEESTLALHLSQEQRGSLHPKEY